MKNAQRTELCNPSIGVVLIVLVIMSLRPALSADINLQLGDDFQEKVDARPAGTTYRIACGIHRLQQVVPKDGDTFIGDSGAVVSGAKLLTDWEQYNDSIWVCEDSSLRYNYTQPFGCANESDPAICNLNEELFIDNMRIRETSSPAGVTSQYIETAALDTIYSGSRWCLDRATDRVYIAVNPAGRTIEISQADYAFSGPAENVTIKNLVIEKYCSGARCAVVGQRYGGGAGWIVENNEIRFNHGTGVCVTGPQAIVRNNYIHTHGQIGIVGLGKSVVVENNLLAYNCATFYAWHFEFFNTIFEIEAGGLALVDSDSAIVRHNYAHHNRAPALWSFSNNSNATFAYNVADTNYWGAAGIMSRGDDTAAIFCNKCAGNQGAGVYISNSNDVNVFNNIIVSPYIMTGMYETPLAAFSTSSGNVVRMLKNISVRRNDVTMHGFWQFNGVFEINTPIPPDSVTSRNISFDSNSYHIVESEIEIWAGRNFGQGHQFFAKNLYTFEEWQAHGQETGGSLDNDLSWSGHAAVMARCGETPGLTGPVGPEWNEITAAKFTGHGDHGVQHALQPAVRLDGADKSLEIDIKGRPGNACLAIYNSLGRNVLKTDIADPQKKTVVDIGGLRSGVYFVRLDIGKHAFTSRLVLK